LQNGTPKNTNEDAIPEITAAITTAVAEYQKKEQG
jgi:hypothetical protein